MARRKPFKSNTPQPENTEFSPREKVEDAISGGWDANYIPGKFFTPMESLLKLAGSIRVGSAATVSKELFGELGDILLDRNDTRPALHDPRFSSSHWQDSAVFWRLSQSYLAWSQAMRKLIDDEPDQNWRDREHAKLVLEILISAASPANFMATNPDAVDEAIKTRGASLYKGVSHLIADLRAGKKTPSHVGSDQFEVGENLAVTPGAVVFRNEVLELIQYRPTTAKVLTEPTLIIPPQINKYYFLDIAPGRSFVEYAVSRGITTFMVSWVNPGSEQGDWDLDTYVAALLEALDAVLSITRSKTLNVTGFCAGGITTVALLNTLATKSDHRVRAAGFAVTLLDFDVHCPLGAFHGQSLLKHARETSQDKGVLSGKDLGNAFNWLRPDDLVWRYWVNNYLMGHEPPAFDILYWNSDSTNLPYALHHQYLNVFEKNLLCDPGTLNVLGQPVDLSTIEVDTFVMASEADHLTPWQGCYRTTQLLKGESLFVRSNGGHIAGLINPPGNPKARYLIGTATAEQGEGWAADAEEKKGSWWEAWADWLEAGIATHRTAPRKLGNARHPVLDNAPGQYVMQQRD